MAVLTVRFVGLGVMGLPMARNVLKGRHAVAGFNRSAGATDTLAADGATAARTAAAADGADVAVLMVPGPEEIEAVLFGEDGVVAGMPAGGLVLVMSTIDPATAQRVKARLQTAELRMLEAPVARPAQNAVDGTLAILVGGTEEDLEQARPMLECMGSDIVYCGPVGTAAAMKLVNNMLSNSMLIMTAEALALGRKAGLAVETMYSVLAGTAANSASLGRIERQAVKSRAFAPGFMVKLAQKDLRLATTFASEVGVRASLRAAAHQMLAEAGIRGYADADTSSVLRLYEEAAGVELG
ncbi:MAG: NAD(P)-dependent oxidoreductase [Chloroflexota bacterium]|jgi:2-hydroxy-3-oxopropionate reductase|nr:NAD(P)-dependent oxidoreductase [Chloroflexota bacterium]MDP6757673.1 NAD(P)-dependent oxidoreductase [Chloroflexota bacterium]